MGCTRRACVSPCSLPAESGPCRASIPAFYYDQDSASCRQFTYGGCGGNANKFASVRDCLQMCSPRGIPLHAFLLECDCGCSHVQTRAWRGLIPVSAWLPSHPSSSTAALACVSVLLMVVVEGMPTGSPVDLSACNLALQTVSETILTCRMVDPNYILQLLRTGVG